MTLFNLLAHFNGAMTFSRMIFGRVAPGRTVHKMWDIIVGIRRTALSRTVFFLIFTLNAIANNGYVTFYPIFNFIKCVSLQDCFWIFNWRELIEHTTCQKSGKLTCAVSYFVKFFGLFFILTNGRFIFNLKIFTER